jgi:hypothetical protein
MGKRLLNGEQLANSASDVPPFIAVNATFALKAGLGASRVRLVTKTPDPRHHRCCQAENPLIRLSDFPEPPSMLARREDLATAGAREKTVDEGSIHNAVRN